ncbi:MAG: sortase [bacterium]|nr:sortase [bacterium]
MKYILFFLITIILLCHPNLIYAQSFNEIPDTIIIPSIHIFLPVKESSVIFDTWEVDSDGASFGTGSDLPGNAGNTIIFAHALPQLFLKLPEIKIGDQVHVFTKHDWFTYIITQTQTVQPENIDILKSNKPNELTLFTCVGPWFSQRFVVKASLLQDTSQMQ